MKRFIKTTYLAFILLILYVPIMIMMMYSFNSSTSITFFSGWSLDWYKNLWTYKSFIQSIIVSLFVGVISTVISLLIGIPACIGLSKMAPRKRSKWLSIINIPLINADIVTAVSLLICFALMGFKLGLLTLIAAHVSFNVPFVIITILPFMKRIDKDYVSASTDLGASSFLTFRKIILPALYPAIASASVLSFSMSFDDFIISYFTSGSVTNVSTFIYTAQRLQPYINAFGTLLICLIIFFVIIYNIFLFNKSKSAVDKENILNGLYKNKKQNRLYKQLNSLYAELNVGMISKKSHRPSRFIKYRYYKFLYSYYSKKNIDIKIYKLVAKKEKILEDIKWENKVYAQYNKLKLQIEKSTKNDDKLKRKLSRFKRLESDIEWIEKRNDTAQEKIDDLTQELNDLLLQKSLSKRKDKNAHQIREIKKEIAYLQEGPNKYKLRINLDKQREIKDKNAHQIEDLYLKMKDALSKIRLKVTSTYKFDKKIDALVLKNAPQSIINSLEEEKKSWLEKRREFIISKIETIEATIDVLSKKAELKKEKLIGIKKGEPVITKKNYKLYIFRNKLKRSLKGLILCTILITATILFTILYVQEGSYDIVIANWGSYINQRIITDFEKKYDIKIGYQEYDSNETLFNKQEYYNYDIMFPSDYMVQKLAENNKIQRLDWSKINTKYYIGSDKFPGDDDSDKFTTDENSNHFVSDIYKLQKNSLIKSGGNITDYSLPYWWGSVYIVFNMENKNVVNFMNEHNISYDKETNRIDPKTLSWQYLWDAANAGMTVNLNEDSKNLFMYALENQHGFVEPPNSNYKSIVDDAEDALNSLVIEHSSNVHLLEDQLIDQAVAGNFDVSVMYSGDILYAENQNNHNYAVGAPGMESQDGTPQGTNIWTDNLVIGKNNRNIDLTYEFINYLYQVDIQEKNVDETSITSPVENYNNKWIEKNVDKKKQTLYDFYKLDGADSTNNKSFGYNPDSDDYLVSKYSDLISKLK